MDLKDKIKVAHTAVLVIDIQNDFCSPNGKLAIENNRDFSEITPMVKRLKEFIDFTEHNNILTLYTQQIYDRSKLNPLQLEQYDLDNKYITCDIDTDGYKFYQINSPKERVFMKHNYNAFSNQSLLEILSNKGIKTLIITGVDTTYCIETAIRNGFDLGYKIVVPKDLIVGNAKHADLNLKTLTMVMKGYGTVTTSVKLIKLLG